MSTARSALLAASALVLCLTAPAGAQQPRPQPPRPSQPAGAPVQLRMRYVQGQRVRYLTRTVQTAPAPVGRTTTTVRMEVETLRTRPDGTADLRMHVTRMDIAGAAIPAAARAEISREMTGMRMEYTQDDRGQITNRRPPTGVGAEMRPILDAVTQSLDQMAPQLPERPVAVGESWTERRSLSTGAGPGANLDMSVETRYTLRELRPGPAGQTAVIGLTMTLALPQGANVARVPVTGGGTATGDMTIELWRAVLSRSRSQGTLTMRVAANGRNVDVRTQFDNDMTAENVAP